jgi:hypothetical protein
VEGALRTAIRWTGAQRRLIWRQLMSQRRAGGLLEGGPNLVDRGSPRFPSRTQTERAAKTPAKATRSPGLLASKRSWSSPGQESPHVDGAGDHGQVPSSTSNKRPACPATASPPKLRWSSCLHPFALGRIAVATCLSKRTTSGCSDGWSARLLGLCPTSPADDRWCVQALDPRGRRGHQPGTVRR